ncbi:MAG: magnesium protoporphyrin IX methyltransferase [Pseudomonadota bacterium]
MMSDTYSHTRGKLEDYFDRTASETWARLTSDAPVSRIRQTVRAGRDRMRAVLLGHLPQQLHGRRVLDAGCGAGQMAIELAERGAEVVAVDISPNLLGVARARTPENLAHRIDYRAGDMLDEGLGVFDHVIAMDSLIHYRTHDIVTALSGLAHRTQQSIHFTTAPKTALLTVMHAVGQVFPRSDRSPAIQPVAEPRLRRACGTEPALRRFKMPPSERVKSGFYISQAMRLVR